MPCAGRVLLRSRLAAQDDAALHAFQGKPVAVGVLPAVFGFSGEFLGLHQDPFVARGEERLNASTLENLRSVGKKLINLGIKL